jgi:hypothetical protein
VNSFDRCHHAAITLPIQQVSFLHNPTFFANTNSANYNTNRTVTNVNNYYDQNGGITTHLYSQSSYSTFSEMDTTLLVTDQFSLTFNRTLTAVTDVNGAYSFPGLPDGNYTVTVTKPTYAPATGIHPAARNCFC